MSILAAEAINLVQHRLDELIVPTNQEVPTQTHNHASLHSLFLFALKMATNLRRNHRIGYQSLRQVFFHFLIFIISEL